MKAFGYGIALFVLGACSAMALSVGDSAPAFSGSATGGKTLSLSDFEGSWVVLYFYPKADTPGCTRQSCSLRDGYADLQAHGAVVIGVSLDTIDRQEAFREKHNLPFPLIADNDKKIAEAYEVVAPLGLFAQRKTFVIDPAGNIAHIFERVDVGEHDEEVLRELTRLQAARESEAAPASGAPPAS